MILLLALLLAQAPSKVRVCDKSNPTQCAAVNSAGQVSIGGTISASSSCHATAAAPSYVEGTDDPLSCDLVGTLRTTAGGGGGAVDVSDRAGRLLGVTYGSQGQQLKQTAVNFNLVTESFVAGSAIDPRSIRLLTASDVVDVSDRSARLLGHVTVDNASLTVDVSDRAARLLGIVYGSQSQQLKQTATNFNLQVESAVGGTLIDPRSIRALTASDVVTTTIGTDSVGLAKDATLALLTLSQGSTTSGQKGPLVQAAVSNSPPSYTDLTTAPLSMNLVGDLRTRTDVAKVAGVNTVNGGVGGSMSVGGTQANNAAINSNPLMDGLEALSTQPAAATTGNARRMTGGLDGALYVRPFTQQWSCGLTAIAATLTECKAAPAAGLKAYITDMVVISDTTTAGQITLRFGTGTNCATGPTTLFPNVASITTGKYPYPGNGAINPMYYSFATPLAPTAANAVCAICVATNTCTVTLIGYTAP